jgi:hypothetical protein
VLLVVQFLLVIPVDPVVLKDEILNIMIAGRDTVRGSMSLLGYGLTVCDKTAGTLTFVVYLLSTHPRVLSRLREEIATKIGLRNYPTYEAIRDMKYLRAVINGKFLPVFERRDLINCCSRDTETISGRVSA